MTMIRQRVPGSAPAIQAIASRLPLGDGSLDAAMAVLTVHHWTNLPQSLRELCRVARKRVVILTWEPDSPEFWLTQEYFPGIRTKDNGRFPTVSAISRELGPVRVETVSIPKECSDGFLGAFWCRPHAYLNAGTRASMSGFADLPNVDEGLARLRRDIEAGAWERRFGHLRNDDQIDLGYRLIIRE
jgi:SAM-dependent methyltransferase